MTHGTSKAYETGCRCRHCRAYQARRVARNRKQRLASGSLNHGTRSAYDAGCRCFKCRVARSKASEREYERKNAS